MKDPAFLFYSKDWLEGTAEFTAQEKGVYIDLLCYQHQKRSLPVDELRLARLVGLSIEDFRIVWEILSTKFNRLDNRLVNQRLQHEMTDRASRGLKNRIIGIFASIMRLSNLSKTNYVKIRKAFNINEFKNISTDWTTERITECITEWFNERLKSIEDGNESGDGNGNVNTTGNTSSEKGKNFIKPKIDEVILFFTENGFLESAGKKAFEYYNEADWHDSKGNKIKNWKQKMRGVWFKDVNEDKTEVEFFTEIQNKWFELYQLEKKTNPTFDLTDESELNDIIIKIKSKTTEIGLEWNQENAILGFEAVFKAATKTKWIQDNMELKNINSKFNTIYSNGKQKFTDKSEFIAEFEARFGK